MLHYILAQVSILLSKSPPSLTMGFSITRLFISKRHFGCLLKFRLFWIDFFSPVEVDFFCIIVLCICMSWLTEMIHPFGLVLFFLTLCTSRVRSSEWSFTIFWISSSWLASCHVRPPEVYVSMRTSTYELIFHLMLLSIANQQFVLASKGFTGFFAPCLMARSFIGMDRLAWWWVNRSINHS